MNQMATFPRIDLKPRVEFPMHEYREKNTKTGHYNKNVIYCNEMVIHF